VRALFISDVHLGTAASQAKRLLSFLRCYQADMIYLVGDIVDGWRLLRGRSWPPSHLAVMNELVASAQAGVRVIYIPGNHDEYLRSFIGVTVGGVEIADRAVHESVRGQRYLVLHGDELDRMVQRVPWVASLGNLTHRASLAVNNVAVKEGCLRRYYRAASARTKLTLRTAVNAIGRSEELLVAEARRLGVDGVVCGHTHEPADCDLAGMHYLNTGDWVESCTGVIERLDGRLFMVRWSELATVPQISAPLVDLGDVWSAGEDIRVTA
jgi:UDP-2,3-diacylglucosamine pyrophosphatase LpxH